MVSASGRSQTVARFQLRCKAQLIDVQLPEGSTLWSAYLDGKPTLPQREADSLLVELPATAEARRRDLQLVYETPVDTLGMASSLDLAAPKLLLRAKAEHDRRGSAAGRFGLATEHARWIQSRAEQWNGVQRRYCAARIAGGERGGRPGRRVRRRPFRARSRTPKRSDHRRLTIDGRRSEDGSANGEFAASRAAPPTVDSTSMRNTPPRR